MKDILHIFVEKVALNNSQYLILFLFLEFVHSQNYNLNFVRYSLTCFYIFYLGSQNLHFSSVARSCLTLCDPMNRSTPE